jgi:hypothetical protein
MTPKKEARPKDRANLYSLRRNIVMNRRKTTANLITSGKIHRHFRHFSVARALPTQKQLTPLCRGGGILSGRANGSPGGVTGVSSASLMEALLDEDA